MLRPAPASSKPAYQWRDGGYLARTLSPSDANNDYLSWIANPRLMNALNMPARKLTLTELKAQIGQYDQRGSLLAGIFRETPDGLRLIGVFVVTLNLEHRLARVSGFIGEEGPAPHFIKFVKSVFGYLFESRGVEKIGAQVAASNRGALAACWALGMRHEGLLRGEIRKFDGSGRLDQHAFGLLREEWRERLKPGGFRSGS
ncbi:MAG: GNAT family N-acetyltransferase [Alphaproteobacteria bacterium]|nr:GNAT family N-acetyltransferase [Alphaproteobacteria bacterium]